MNLQIVVIVLPEHCMGFIVWEASWEVNAGWGKLSAALTLMPYNESHNTVLIVDANPHAIPGDSP